MEIKKNLLLRPLLTNLPTIILFFTVLNEVDLNHLNLDFFSINFVHILIFYWSLKNPKYLPYGYIFLAGLVNDVITGIPIGISSLCYLLMCVITAYIRNITLRPIFFNDWMFFLLSLFLVNSIQMLILDLFFLIEINYFKYSINIVFTFLLYPLFVYMFDIFQKRLSNYFYD